MLHDSAHVPKPSLTEILFGVFLRLVAASCIWFALNYWAMLIGFSHGGAGRFDLLSPEWRAAATALAVVYPVAALGLWLLSVTAALTLVLTVTIVRRTAGEHVDA